MTRVHKTKPTHQETVLKLTELRKHGFQVIFSATVWQVPQEEPTGLKTTNKKHIGQIFLSSLYR